MKVAFFSFGACEGCRYRMVNELSRILSIDGIEIVREPLLGLASEDEYDIAVVEGALTSHDMEKCKEIRSKAKYVIALGSCAYLGGITTLGYKYGFQAEEYIKRGYKESIPLQRVIGVDNYVRGCPASIEELANVLREIITSGALPRYERRFEFEKISSIVLKDEFLKLDTGKCIVCGRCVEICSQINVHALTQAFRGFRVIVSTPGQLSFLEAGCIHCGLCAAICPVGAVTYRSDIEASLKAIRSGASVVAEITALDAAAKALGVETGQTVSLLKQLGASNVKVVDPINLVTNKVGIVPFSVAEERWIKVIYPQASEYLLQRPILNAQGVLLITACASRKEEHTPTLTAHELTILAKGCGLVLEDLPAVNFDFQPASRSNLRVVKGPSESTEAIQEFLESPTHTLRKRIWHSI
ncbi:MAG: 4Fe-4S dicluster domain-containing protein [Thermofilaceae archaeon]